MKKYYNEAIKLGSINSMFDLGNYYRRLKDHTSIDLAINYLKMAMDHGYDLAILNLLFHLNNHKRYLQIPKLSSENKQYLLERIKTKPDKIEKLRISLDNLDKNPNELIEIVKLFRD